MYDEASQVDLETLKIEGWPQILKIDLGSPHLYHATLTGGWSQWTALANMGHFILPFASDAH